MKNYALATKMTPLRGLAFLVAYSAFAYMMAASANMSTATSVKCDLCEIAVKYTDDFLTRNKTEVAIEDVLERACNIVPSRYASTCDQFIVEYTPILLKYLTEKADPDTICTLIGVC